MDDGKPAAKAAHVNMMTDTVIANMPLEGLQSIMRGMLGGDATITSNFHNLALIYLENTQPATIPELFRQESGRPQFTSSFRDIQSRYRCLMGCGHAFQSMELLNRVIQQVNALEWDENTSAGAYFLDSLAAIDGDIVQAVTAVQKKLLTSSGMRPMNDDDAKVVSKLRNLLEESRLSANMTRQTFPFERGLSALEALNTGASRNQSDNIYISRYAPSSTALESVVLGNFQVPRMFMGLWQFSSTAWGTASRSKINQHFREHVDAGLMAYDMADHYGDAEVTFGQFRSSQPDASKIYCATKWAVFEPIKITKEAVDANISERLAAIHSESIELLQFHWQDYNDHQYVEACRLIEEHPKVASIGLCNFDTARMEEILDSGVNIVSNQVQFSLIDLRPTFKMAESCLKHNVKLLTYGSLCGGFLADKWLGQPAPNLFDAQMTPSHRKYFEMITIWGGWPLFQELLTVLAGIGKKYGASISNVAIRWILDHEYVGAVIIGARMGISEHIKENLVAFSFVLDQIDQEKIDAVLANCHAKEVFEDMGDCGAEYR